MTSTTQDYLSEPEIRAALSDRTQDFLADLLVFDCIDSTNAELMRHSQTSNGAQVCLADAQTAGRGRRGRPWSSPQGSNIYCSVRWSFSSGAEALAGLPLAVGAMLCECLSQAGVDGLEVKWPNDVLRRKKKLAGVLVETQGNFDGPVSAVIGTGINVVMPAQDAQAIEQPWSDLRDVPDLASRNTLIASWLDTLIPALADYESTGFSAWRHRWLAYDAYTDSPVVVISGENRTNGIARGVDETGALRLETASGIRAIHGGEVSMRPDQ